MDDTSKTKDLLIKEVQQLRQRVAQLEAVLAQRGTGHLISDEKRRREELEKLREISTNMRQAEGSGDLLQLFTKEVQDFFGADVTSSVLFKAPQAPITYFAPRASQRLSPEQSGGLLTAMLNAKNGEFSAIVPGFESVLILPLQSSDMMHGVVALASRLPVTYTPDDNNMLNAIADMAGTALQRIDILETLEERVQRRTHDLVVLYNLITIVSENWRLQDILELSMILTLETVKADRCIIYLVDGKVSQDLKPVIQRGFSDGFAIKPASLPDDKLARTVFLQHKALALEDLSEHHDFSKFDGIASYAAVPILARGEVRGVFSLFANETGVFGPDEMALLASIADHLGIGIENSILWEQSRENAALEERNRLARNLHDSVSQLLYSLTLIAGSTKKMLEREHDVETIKNSVTRLGDIAHQALKEMRLLLYELRPVVIDSEGLVNALQHRIETVEERLGLHVDMQAQGIQDLPSNMEDTLYHIALEALNNIVKHADTNSACIKLTQKSRIIEMEISDHGKGFNPDLPRNGLGLENMRERAQMLGGDLYIYSSPGDGTRVISRVKIP